MAGEGRALVGVPCCRWLLLFGLLLLRGGGTGVCNSLLVGGGAAVKQGSSDVTIEGPAASSELWPPNRFWRTIVTTMDDDASGGRGPRTVVEFTYENSSRVPWMAPLALSDLHAPQAGHLTQRQPVDAASYGTAFQSRFLPLGASFAAATGELAPLPGEAPPFLTDAPRVGVTLESRQAPSYTYAVTGAFELPNSLRAPPASFGLRGAFGYAQSLQAPAVVSLHVLLSLFSPELTPAGNAQQAGVLHVPVVVEAGRGAHPLLAACGGPFAVPYVSPAGDDSGGPAAAQKFTQDFSCTPGREPAGLTTPVDGACAAGVALLSHVSVTVAWDGTGVTLKSLTAYGRLGEKCSASEWAFVTTDLPLAEATAPFLDSWLLIDLPAPDGNARLSAALSLREQDVVTLSDGVSVSSMPGLQGQIEVFAGASSILPSRLALTGEQMRLDSYGAAFRATYDLAPSAIPADGLRRADGSRALLGPRPPRARRQRGGSSAPDPSYVSGLTLLALCYRSMDMRSAVLCPVANVANETDIVVEKGSTVCLCYDPQKQECAPPPQAETPTLADPCPSAVPGAPKARLACRSTSYTSSSCSQQERHRRMRLILYVQRSVSGEVFISAEVEWYVPAGETSLKNVGFHFGNALIEGAAPGSPEQPPLSLWSSSAYTMAAAAASSGPVSTTTEPFEVQLATQGFGSAMLPSFPGAPRELQGTLLAAFGLKAYDPPGAGAGRALPAVGMGLILYNTFGTDALGLPFVVEPEYVALARYTNVGGGAALCLPVHETMTQVFASPLHTQPRLVGEADFVPDDLALATAPEGASSLLNSQYGTVVAPYDERAVFMSRDGSNVVTLVLSRQTTSDYGEAALTAPQALGERPFAWPQADPSAPDFEDVQTYAIPMNALSTNGFVPWGWYATARSLALLTVPDAFSAGGFGSDLQLPGGGEQEQKGDVDTPFEKWAGAALLATSAGPFGRIAGGSWNAGEVRTWTAIVLSPVGEGGLSLWETTTPGVLAFWDLRRGQVSRRGGSRFFEEGQRLNGAALRNERAHGGWFADGVQSAVFFTAVSPMPEMLSPDNHYVSTYPNMGPEWADLTTTKWLAWAATRTAILAVAGRSAAGVPMRASSARFALVHASMCFLAKKALDPPDHLPRTLCQCGAGRGQPVAYGVSEYAFEGTPLAGLDMQAPIQKLSVKDSVLFQNAGGTWEYDPPEDGKPEQAYCSGLRPQLAGPVVNTLGLVQQVRVPGEAECAASVHWASVEFSGGPLPTLPEELVKETRWEHAAREPGIDPLRFAQNVLQSADGPLMLPLCQDAQAVPWRTIRAADYHPKVLVLDGKRDTADAPPERWPLIVVVAEKPSLLRSNVLVARGTSAAADGACDALTTFSDGSAGHGTCRLENSWEVLPLAPDTPTCKVTFGPRIGGVRTVVSAGILSPKAGGHRFLSAPKLRLYAGQHGCYADVVVRGLLQSPGIMVHISEYTTAGGGTVVQRNRDQGEPYRKGWARVYVPMPQVAERPAGAETSQGAYDTVETKGVSVVDAKPSAGVLTFFFTFAVTLGDGSSSAVNVRRSVRAAVKWGDTSESCSVQ